MNKIPRVSVLMPVYNAQNFLYDSIFSILNQTFFNFEFVIINDGSTDESDKIIKSFVDKRIKYFNFPYNQGLVNSLNFGISVIESEYILRMDADDISFLDRIEKLICFMDNNRDYGLCGSLAVDFENNVINNAYNNEFLKTSLLIECPIVHPTVILRNSVIKQYNLSFNHEFQHAEDYEFWVRLSKITKLHVVDEVLLKYRIHDQQVSVNFSNIQNRNSLRVRRELFNSFLADPLTSFEDQLIDFSLNKKSIRLIHIIDFIDRVIASRSRYNDELLLYFMRKFFFRNIYFVDFSFNDLFIFLKIPYISFYEKVSFLKKKIKKIKLL